jgi:hypothetical protein
MVNDIENYYLEQSEPIQSCLFALREIIKSFDQENITEEWKHNIPFFYYKGKMFCYFGKSKSKKQLYIGIIKGSEIKHPSLIKGKRKMIKIFKVNPAKDIDIVSLYEVLELAKACYSKVV